MTKLSLFPLKLILLPGGLLPLRAFEPRYIHLLQDTIGRESIGIIQPTISDNEEENADTLGL